MQLPAPAFSPLAAAVLLAHAASAQSLAYVLGAEATNNDDFGRAVADAGDLDGDGVGDLIVGAPFDGAGGALSGSVFSYSGASGALIWTRAGEHAGDAFGWSVDGVGDRNSDGHDDVIVGAPLWDNNGAWNSGSGRVYVLSGATGAPMITFSFNELNAQLGYAVRGLGDIDGDGVGDFAYGIPWRDNGAVLETGYVAVFSGASASLLFSRYGDEAGAKLGYSLDVVQATGQPVTSRLVLGEPGINYLGVDRGRVRYVDGLGNIVSQSFGSADNDWYGAAVAGIGDINNDGAGDYAIGAPYADVATIGADAGRISVVSGAGNLLLISATGSTAGAQFGASISGFGDFNGDGRKDFLVGAPNDSSGASGGGQVRVLSGFGGAVLGAWTGGVNDHMGRSVSSAGDLNLDGVNDIFYGANDAPFGAGEAYVRLSRLPEPAIYCTALVNSQGCTPAVAWQGLASLSIGDGVEVSAANVINQKSGILFWGYASNNAPFQGGTLCVQAPLIRTPIQSSGGNPSPDDCSGAYLFHFSRPYFAAKGVLAGSRVHAQFWSRDSAAATNIGLTNAVRFDVAP